MSPLVWLEVSFLQDPVVQGILDQYSIDELAREALGLLAAGNRETAAQILFRLTKKTSLGHNVTRPSQYIYQACQNAFGC